MSDLDWEINIENAANAVVAKYGFSTVKSVFQDTMLTDSMTYLLATKAKHSLI